MCEHLWEEVIREKLFFKILEINFVINEIKVYLEKPSLLNIHEATSLLDLDKPQRHYLLHIFNFFPTKTIGLS